jgi:hypothetical protein
VRMSASLPFFYVPFRLRSTITGQDSLMMDGGLVSARSTRQRLFDDGHAAAEAFLENLAAAEAITAVERVATD